MQALRPVTYNTTCALGLQLVILAAGSDQEIDGIFATLGERQIQALLVTADGLDFTVVVNISGPLCPLYPLSDRRRAGCSINVAQSFSCGWKLASTSKILKGAKPGESPIM